MKSIAILSIAGLAAAATAQSVTLHFDLDGDPLTASDVSGNSGSWTVLASFTGTSASGYFGGFTGSWNNVGDGSGTASNLVSLMAGNATTPSANGASIEGINIFHSALLGTDNSNNPLAIFTFDTTLDSGSIEYSATGVASLFGDDGIFTLPSEFTDAQINIISDRLVPAPGAAALLGLGGLAAARRRR